MSKVKIDLVPHVMTLSNPLVPHASNQQFELEYLKDIQYSLD